MEYFVTRVGFCSKCYEAKRPKSADEFLAYGFTCKRFLEMEAEHMGLAGFVPHIYKLFTKDNKIFMQSACAMKDCGVNYFIDKKGAKRWTIFKESWSKPKVITVAEIRALNKFKDTGYKI